MTLYVSVMFGMQVGAVLLTLLAFSVNREYLTAGKVWIMVFNIGMAVWAGFLIFGGGS